MQATIEVTETKSTPKTFAEVRAEHLVEIIDLLKAGNRNGAAEKFGELVDSLKDVKQYEVVMLRDKVMGEAGLLPKRRSK